MENLDHTRHDPASDPEASVGAIIRSRVLGVPVDHVNMEQALALAEFLLARDEPSAVFAVNPEKVMAARSDSRLADCLDQARLLIPDGIGVVMAVRMMRKARLAQVTGVELMERMVEKAAREGHPVFFYGAREEINEKAVESLVERYPGFQAAGRAHGYLGPEEQEALVDKINASGARIVFVALGSPKQELWISENLPRLKARWVQGVGGSFDVISGKVKRSPRPLIKLHLEWLYRLIVDFRRLPRYRRVFQFMILAIREALGQNRGGPGPG